ncbi:MAG: class I SAM-dependent methyltransferase [Planctomycetes bacterium]|nr:class I SAM-dependent methyltransferase [Planctomycetota bacterium]
MPASFPALEPEALACPCCGAQGLQAFYDVPRVPVNSCILMATREEALAYPRGHLRLALCPACGFVASTRFDPKLEYSARYEETQAFSGTFNAFARRLVEDLVERQGVRGKTVLEIGCGKGEFLVQLCEAGGNRGVGIDPGYRPERTRTTAQVEFIRDFYGERHADLQADVIVCRHTLEHIERPRELIRSIRRQVGDRRDVLVFFEVPDVLRVLQEGAFWDLYHEHCSYFTAGSLTRLFRQEGFEVTELELAFADQYVLLAARPADGPTAPALPLEHDLEATRAAVAAFSDVCRRQLEAFGAQLRAAAARGERTVVWGSGSKGVAFLTTLGDAGPVECVVDVNPHRQGRFMPGTGHPIVSPEALVGVRPDHVVVMNPIYVQEIGRDLARLALTPSLRAAA